jgi:flagellar biosynthesis GTPase FlhF
MEAYLQEDTRVMTEVLIVSFLMMFGGYIVGKLFVKLNPFLMIIGFIFIAITSPAFIEMDNDYYMACFVFGAILNFSRPVSYVRDLFGTLSLRRAGAGYVANIEEQKQQAEADLYSQKHQVEEDLRRQKQEAEQDIQRQRREAEEAIRREAESLRRERKKYQQSSDNSQGSQSRNNSQESNSSTNDKRHLNPLVFADACEIMGLGQGKTLKEYKRAHHKLISQSHSDKLAGLSEELKKQEEEKAKTLNVAMGTIKKKLR